MSINNRSFTLLCALVLFLAGTSLVQGQVSNTETPQARTSTVHAVPAGVKMKFQGVVVDRSGDTFTIRDRSRTDYQVLITDNTSIKTHGGFLKGGKKYPVTDILRGLIVQVEGRGDAQGQIVADKIRFNESDMRAALTTETRVAPVEEAQRKMSGQMDELYAIAAEVRQEVAMVNERVSSLDDYDVGSSVAVNFRLNSAVLSPEAKRQLDDFATKALAAKGYMIEIAGHTDSTGSYARNMRLSRERAESVIEYLTISHKIPARRFITPMGYGKTEAVADNSTAAGRAQNRRVEVKLLVNRGLNSNGRTSTVKP
jgi:outer membrane protein OmpA-like peptidoglycan-associated protein